MRSATQLLDLVQRRHPDDVVFPQPDWHPDRNDRQPDAGRDPVRARHAAAARGRAQPDSAADVLLPRKRSSTRSPTTTRSSTSRRSGTKTFSSTCYRWRRTPSTRATATTGRFIRSGSKRRVRRSKRRRGEWRNAENIGPRAALGGRGGGGGGRGGAPIAVYNNVLHDPKMRDPRGFILPSDQPDFPTATKFVNILIKGGVTVHRATAPFAVAGKQYPGWLVRRQSGAAVPRAPDGHVRAAGSPGRHPVSRRPAAPAVRRHRLQHRATRWASSSIGSSTAFDGPFEKIPDLAPVPTGKVAQGAERRRLSPQPSGERRVRGRESAPESERRGLLAEVRDERRTASSIPSARCTSRPRPRRLPILQKVAADKGRQLRRGAVQARGRFGCG